ncbi:MAG: hypothetical protein ACRC1W_13255 [Shewanella sp.]
MEERDEPIDLDNLSQRELLIVLARDMRDMKKDVRLLEEGQEEIRLKVNTLETKSKVAGGIAGFLTGLATILIEKFINR